MVVDLDHPGRAFVVTALAGPDDLARDEILDQLPHDVPVGAQHGIAQRAITKKLTQAFETVAFDTLLAITANGKTFAADSRPNHLRSDRSSVLRLVGVAHCRPWALLRKLEVGTKKDP